MFAYADDANRVLRARSDRHARNAWGRLVDQHGEPTAFAELSAMAGGSDAAYHALDVRGIHTDIG